MMALKIAKYSSIKNLYLNLVKIKLKKSFDNTVDSLIFVDINFQIEENLNFCGYLILLRYQSLHTKPFDKFVIP